MISISLRRRVPVSQDGSEGGTPTVWSNPKDEARECLRPFCIAVVLRGDKILDIIYLLHPALHVFASDVRKRAISFLGFTLDALEHLIIQAHRDLRVLDIRHRTAYVVF